MPLNNPKYKGIFILLLLCVIMFNYAQGSMCMRKTSSGSLDQNAICCSEQQLGALVGEISDECLGFQNLNFISNYFTINKSSSTLVLESHEGDNSFLNMDIKSNKDLQKVEFYNPYLYLEISKQLD